MQLKVPIIYAYLYCKIKKRNSGDKISLPILKQIIVRHFICSKGRNGGSKKGLPSIYIYDLIKELEDMKLIRRINQQKFQILKSKCEKNLRKFPY